MIQIKRLLTLLLLVLAMGLVANAQTYTRSGNTFISSTGERVKAEPVKTKFTWKDSKGREYPVYISSNGSCFVIKVNLKWIEAHPERLIYQINKYNIKNISVESADNIDCTVRVKYEYLEKINEDREDVSYTSSHSDVSFNDYPEILK